MSDSHEEVNELASFISQEIQVGKHTLRPLSAGSLAVLQSVGNAFFTEDTETPEDAEASNDLDGETIDALCEYIYAHAKLPKLVVKMARDPKAFRDAARELCFDVSLDDFASFLQDMGSIQEATAAAIVEPIEESDAEPGKPQPSPTGLPSLSTTSELPETPSEKTTSSGASRSINPSNTSTQPTGQTEPAADSSTSEVPASHPHAAPSNS